MKRTEEVAARFYEGLWGVLAKHLRVPRDPPELPATATATGDAVSFRPDEAFLDYLKLQFWIAFAIIDLVIGIAWIAILIANPIVGALLFVPAVLLAVVPDAYAWVALHLRYDTTWYAMNDRSLRTRRGVWLLHEVSITFENVQNVKVVQGPLQRMYGLASVVVETAGSGGGEQQSLVSNQGVIEGVRDANAIRDRILDRVRESRGAGLGDDRSERAASTGLGPEHVAALREIRDEVRALGGAG